MLNEQHFYLFGQIRNSQTGGQLYCDTFPYGDCSLANEILAGNTLLPFKEQYHSTNVLPLEPTLLKLPGKYFMLP